jgi:hypothetical protein
MEVPEVERKEGLFFRLSDRQREMTLETEDLLGLTAKFSIGA